jgi:hypothetical protein
LWVGYQADSQAFTGQQRVKREHLVDHFAPTGSESMVNHRAAFFEPYRDLPTNPSLMGIIGSLADVGWNVDIFMPPYSGLPHIPGQNIRRRPFPARPPIVLGRMQHTCQAWIEFIGTLLARRKHAQGAYHLVFGVDSAGIIAAARYCEHNSTPLIYLSYEIFFTDELKTRKWLKIKQEEKHACQKADLVIIQDTKRAELLSVENQVDISKFMLLPVAPRQSECIQSNFLREHFHIPPEKTIVLHSGSFAEWTCAEQLLRSASSWPADFVLVIHTSYRPAHFDPWVRAVWKARLPNVYLSSYPFAAEEYEKLVSSADIGLALYQPVNGSPFTQKNIENVGLSSGKFSFYMKCGLPTITMSQPVYRALSEKYKFGEVISDIGDIPLALKRIQADPIIYRHDAKRLFDEQLDFDLFWPPIRVRIENLITDYAPIQQNSCLRRSPACD